MVSIKPIQDFFLDLRSGEYKKCSPPSCAASPPRGTGRIAMPRHYLYRAHIQVIRHYRNWGMPGRRGRRLAGAPKSGNENFVSGLSNFWWMLHNHLILLICSFILDKSFVAVCQTSSGFIPEYWWTRRYRRAMISCHGTEV